jgi:hypothetical protein
MVKKYFFRLSPRDEEGVSWCSIILAQSIPFSIFMDKAKYSLENNDFSLWPKASDNKNTTDVGWLLYSTRAQDKERLTALLSKLIRENIGLKWKPIKVSSNNNRRKDQPASEDKIRDLHVECAVDCMQDVKDKLSVWYSSCSKKFPDGTKMRLVPTISSATSTENKTKFASCIARQAALNAGLASAITREISTNLLLDRKDPATNKSFREVLMEIVPDQKPRTTLFHTIDKQFKSDSIVNFQFHPDNASEANNLIAGLVPFLKDNGHSFHLKMFTPEAIKRQARSRWDSSARVAHSETDVELLKLLAEDDELNFTDEPTYKHQVTGEEVNQNSNVPPHVSIDIPSFPAVHMPSLRPDDDSVSTFHPRNAVDLTAEDEQDEAEEEQNAVDNSLQPAQKSPVSILKTSKLNDPDQVSRMSMSGSASRISSLESNLLEMDKAFRGAIENLQVQAVIQAKEQLQHRSMLTEIISLLKFNNLNSNLENTTKNLSEVANHPQKDDAGDLSKVTIKKCGYFDYDEVIPSDHRC